MVVLLESKSVKDSKWTQHEIDFAKRYRLGLACVRMPGLNDSEVLPSVAAHPRVTLAESDFAEPPRNGEWQRLNESAEESVIRFIKQQHAAALFERRRRIREDTRIALAAAGVRVSADAVGPIRASVGGCRHLIWITTRPPEVDDFQTLHAAHLARPDRTPQWRAAIVGPQAALEPDRRRRLAWLQDRSECPAFDEARLNDFALQVASWK